MSGARTDRILCGHSRTIKPRVILEGASFHARVKSGDRRILRGHKTKVTFVSKGELPPSTSLTPPSAEGGSIRCTLFYSHITSKRIQFDNEITSNSRIPLSREGDREAVREFPFQTNVTSTSNNRIWNPPLQQTFNGACTLILNSSEVLREGLRYCKPLTQSVVLILPRIY